MQKRGVLLRRLFSLLALVLAMVGSLRAQQMYQYTQFMFNNYMVNPAVVGTYNYYQIRTNHRFQWLGVKDAPMTNSVTVYGPHPKLPMGYGGMFYHDMTGPTTRMGLMGSYGYNIPINSETRLSFGVSIGAMIFMVDASKFDLGDDYTVYNNNDPALLDYKTKTAFAPDASVGVYLYASHYYVGIAGQQLVPLNMKLYPRQHEADRIMPTALISGGYLIYLTDNFTMEPSGVIKYTYPYMPMLDANIKITYQNMVWGGISYRLWDAVALMVGYKHQGRLLFGYSFDFSYSSLLSFNYGTHELLIGYQFDRIK